MPHYPGFSELTIILPGGIQSVSIHLPFFGGPRVGVQSCLASAARGKVRKRSSTVHCTSEVACKATRGPQGHWKGLEPKWLRPETRRAPGRSQIGSSLAEILSTGTWHRRAQTNLRTGPEHRKGLEPKWLRPETQRAPGRSQFGSSLAETSAQRQGRQQGTSPFAAKLVQSNIKFSGRKLQVRQCRLIYRPLNKRVKGPSMDV